MKKLMIAAAIVCAAVVTQAAAVSWTTGNLKGSNGTSMYSNKSSGDYTYDAIITYSITPSSPSMTQGGSKFSGTAEGFELNTGYTATLVISEYYRGALNATLTGGAAFTSSASESFAKELNFSTGVGFTEYTGFGDGVGKWVTQSVPEPTSGLLLLLGVAGLALKRKRA